MNDLSYNRYSTAKTEIICQIVNHCLYLIKQNLEKQQPDEAANYSDLLKDVAFSTAVTRRQCKRAVHVI